MVFSPQSAFWDCLYARCCQEMDAYLKPESFWSQITDGRINEDFNFALHDEKWRWFYELYFWRHVAKRSCEQLREEYVLFDKLSGENYLRDSASWNRLSHREKVKEAKRIALKVDVNSTDCIDEYLHAKKCRFHGVTSQDIQAVLQTKPYSKKAVDQKVVAAIDSLGWQWQRQSSVLGLSGNVVAQGRLFNLNVVTCEKYSLYFGLHYQGNNGVILSLEYGYLLHIGGGFESLAVDNLDADIEMFKLMLSRLSVLFASSLDDAEKGLRPVCAHHEPPMRKSNDLLNSNVKSYSVPGVAEAEAELLALLQSEGFIRSDVQPGIGIHAMSDFLAYCGNPRLFILDTECLSGGKEYSNILNKLNEISGENILQDVSSFFDPKRSEAGASFSSDGKTYKGKWRQKDDWMTKKFATLFSEAMACFPGKFVTLPCGGQCAHILYFMSRDAGNRADILVDEIMSFRRK